MNGVHDMGGMTDFGPVLPESDEPLFHAEWERRVLGMVRNIVDGRYNWDEFRFAIERLDPLVYLSSSYYERWLSALERYLVEKGIVTEGELRERTENVAPRPGMPLATTAVCRHVGPETPQPATEGPAYTWSNGFGKRSRGDGAVAADPPRAGETPRFKPGDGVRARNIHPVGHTRLPRYVRGKRGTVLRVLGRFILPDANALGLGEHLQPVYAVRFDARELWGNAARAGDGVCVDLWEGYLQPAEPDETEEA